MSRAKVFQLLNDQWRATGIGAVRFHSASDGDEDFTLLAVQCESTEDLLLTHRVREDVEYGRQGGTVIAWTEDNKELALSFEDVSSCNEAWEQISTIQEGRQSMEEAEEEDDFSDIAAAFPLPDLSNLEDLNKRVNAVKGAHRAQVATRILNSTYLPRLFALFKQIDKGCLVPEGYSLFGFCKGMFLLNDSALLDKLLSEDMILDIISCMEYDMRLPPARVYRTHRDFLQRAQFREPIPIKPELVKCIHLNYRLTYLRDVVMLRYLDDPTLGSVNAIIAANGMTLLTGLMKDEEWMRTFFAEFHKLAGFSVQKAASYMSQLKRKNLEETDELEALEKNFQRKNLFLCLQEMCILARSLLPPHRDGFYAALNSCGIFRAIEDAVCASSQPAEEDMWLWVSVADILSNVLAHDPGLVRNYLNSRLAVPTSLLGALLDPVLLPGIDFGLATQLSSVIQATIDPNIKPIDKEGFVDQFYTKHLLKLTAVLQLPKLGKPPPTPATQQHACDLLTFAVATHPLKSKQLVLSQELGAKIVILLKSPRASLVCSAVRLLRACIGLEDEIVARQLCAQKALDQLVDTFVNNGSRYNLLNSAVLDTLQFIRLQNLRGLVEFLVLNHEGKFKGVDYVQTFQELKLKHEQNQGGSTGSETTVKHEISRLLAKRQEEDEKKKRDIILKQKQMQHKRLNPNLDDEGDLWAAKRLNKTRTRT